jgi:dTDP-4-amino-4,6-dideoxygalactose transaminase
LESQKEESSLRYLHALEGVPGLSLPYIQGYADPAWHLFVVRHSERDKLQEHLNAAGLALYSLSMPPHLQAAYHDLGYSRGSFSLSERVASEVFAFR